MSKSTSKECYSFVVLYQETGTLKTWLVLFLFVLVLISNWVPITLCFPQLAASIVLVFIWILSLRFQTWFLMKYRLVSFSFCHALSLNLLISMLPFPHSLSIWTKQKDLYLDDELYYQWTELERWKQLSLTFFLLDLYIKGIFWVVLILLVLVF